MTDTIKSLQAKNKILIEQLKSGIEKNQDLSAYITDIEEQLFQVNSKSNNDSTVLAQIKELLKEHS